MGGTKGHSITHYLVLLYNFIFSHTSSKHNVPHAVITAICDFSKGFTLLSHNQILTRLSDWGTQPWLLRVLFSYFSDRVMIVRYKGEESNPYSLPAGGAMGDIVGMIAFLVMVSDAAMDPAPPYPLVQVLMM